MKLQFARTLLALVTVFGVLAWSGPAVHAQGTTATLSFASSPTWETFTWDPSTGVPTPIGRAQNVCLNANAPTRCPPGATVYGWCPGCVSWTADLSSIPGATWIWAPGVTGATSPANGQHYLFAKRIWVNGTPTAGAISLAVDNGAKVRINGHSAGTVGCVQTDCQVYAFGFLTTMDITSYLVRGENDIVVLGGNAPLSSCGAPCTYSVNPAGVVFGGSITYQP